MLKRVNLKICPGEFVAIVGESGIGKTTLIRILMAFLETGAGTVDFYNGSGQRQETGAFVRKFIAYVPQGNTLFSGTVRENLQMGREDASEEELWAALKLASGENFVRSLPEGLDTVIGERGHGLSEGQAQRIAIARAMLKNAPIIILDEATAFTDPENEAMIQSAVAKLTKGKTLIVIAHRLSTITNSDQIFVVEDGKIRTSGTHEELLAQDELYARMWRSHISVRDTVEGGAQE